MSYTVLARKWRPKNFSELVGQAHVMQALSNALDQNRLHHAYLFTGTRGVGKTTIARIFSKALNCQQGISSTPCGVCDTCKAIDEGRFIDLIEVDAASRTKVDDTREILDNVQFAPTQGRYKVYLIDEVHMLSKSSFNALLKTLEEPPEHVKFLLATTDPHKLPITVLSRCLQFNLMRLTQVQIQNHLEFILQQENLPFEASALALIAKSADGSARDALSLLDQAIAYGAGQIMFEPVQMMLGLVDQQYTVAILQALAEDSAEGLKAVIQQLALMGVDYSALLAQLIETLHALAFKQVLGGVEESNVLPVEVLQSLSQLLSPQRVQMLYQIALLTKQDMQLAPDMRIGFEMALLRMLAFQPVEASTASGANTDSAIAQPKSSPDNEPTLQEADPQEVLAGLSSARALMSKKQAEPASIETPVEHQGQQGNDHAQQPQAAPARTQTPAEVMEPTPPWEESEIPSAEPSHNTQLDANRAAEVTDHLAQIKQRLKQPLGKHQTSPQTKPASGVQGTESRLVQQEVENPPQDRLFEPQHNQPDAPLARDFLSSPVEQVAPIEESSFELNDFASVGESGQHSGEVSEVESSQPSHNAFIESEKPGFSDQNERHEVSQAVEAQPENQSQTAWQYAALTDENRLQIWLDVLERLQPEGMAAELARQSVLVSYSAESWVLSVDPDQAFAQTDMAVLRLTESVQQTFGAGIKLNFTQAAQHDTPAKQAQRHAAEKQRQAEASIAQDQMVAAFKNELGMEVIASSISPV
ncbi:MAG: DNA polymerase III subunit gamma/tau [Thiomicrorhabdus chilensis]|uniref:DNA polymerase III subunit gamma/tau n=1 Tax=Thiomicrorhabdus chilensis TaxID=63656 RepID=UPI00299CFAC1|nr:DNA polymerase III subunit gamma/tau [Thiomicrorhabdus chilensis]MDX1347253.1 DNA polymerase III subunit gamma/tau [Thiomicrorhabdus chilensis]